MPVIVWVAEYSSAPAHTAHHVHTGAAAAGGLQPRRGGQLPAGRGRGRGHGAHGPLAHGGERGGVQAAALRPGDGEAPLLTPVLTPLTPHPPG